MDSSAHHFQERTMLRSLSAACVFALIAGTTTIADAQGFGNSGSSAFGRSSGSSGFGSSSFGNSGFGSSMGMGGFGSSMGMGGMGSGGMSGFGSMGSGMSGFGNSGMGGMGSGNSTFGNQGMGAGANTGGQSFVGRDSADMASTWNQMGQAGAQFFNQMNRGMNRNNRQNADDQVENPPQRMRVTLQVAFTANRPTPSELTNSLRTRLGRILAAQNIVAPQFTMEGDVAVLGGVAATESQRLVLEKLIAMEPGVREVRNEMTVVPVTATE